MESAIVSATSVCLMLWKDATPTAAFPKDLSEPVRIELPRILVLSTGLSGELGAWGQQLLAMQPWDVSPKECTAQFLDKFRAMNEFSKHLAIDSIEQLAHRDHAVMDILKYRRRCATISKDECARIVGNVARIVGFGDDVTDVETTWMRYLSVHSDIVVASKRELKC
jgi:hypothetical protein